MRVYCRSYCEMFTGETTVLMLFCCQRGYAWGVAPFVSLYVSCTSYPGLDLHDLLVVVQRKRG